MSRKVLFKAEVLSLNALAKGESDESAKKGKNNSADYNCNDIAADDSIAMLCYVRFKPYI